MNKNLKRQYIKLRLNDWGIWELLEVSPRNLNYTSSMGRLDRESIPINSLTLCDFECEQVGIIMSRLKHSHARHYQVGYLYFVKHLGPKEIHEKRGTSQQTVYDTLNGLYRMVDEQLTLIDQQEGLLLEPSLARKKTSL